MLLKSITLHNFRQFKEEKLEFASGEDGRNVTLVLGENGTGKTTFSQAFVWCMYGITNFNDKYLLNKHISTRMHAGTNESVRVDICLIHNGITYYISRDQRYTKDYSGKIKQENATFEVTKKNRDGNTEIINPSRREGEINTILPKELSKYFFFDGERIENMSKEISSKRKSNEFAEAVNSLLGLSAMRQAIDHLNPRMKSSVCGLYETEYAKNGNHDIEKLTDEINKDKNELAKLMEELTALNNARDEAKATIADKEEELKQYEESKQNQERKETLEADIKKYKDEQRRNYKYVCEDFNDSAGFKAHNFFVVSLIDKAVKMLENEDVLGKDIPHIHTKTIDYLIGQRQCICGTTLDEGSLAWKRLQDLKNYLPPQSVSTYIKDFKNESRQSLNSYKSFRETMTDNLELISDKDDDITNALDEIYTLEKKLLDNNASQKVKNIGIEIQKCNEVIRKSTARYDFVNKNIGGLETTIKANEERRKKLASLDEKFKMIEAYKACAERIYKELTEEYNQKEKEVREELEECINEVFKVIYNGGLVLSVDDKYHISVSVTDYEGEVETSTAQSISVIFAFLVSILKLSKKKRESDNELDSEIASEPYPLVMDAPLSALDKRRIKSVCETLPNAAEQVIIFIKDTDGELAENYMGERIGKRHKLQKVDEFETSLV